MVEAGGSGPTGVLGNHELTLEALPGASGWRPHAQTPGATRTQSRKRPRPAASPPQVQVVPPAPRASGSPTKRARERCSVSSPTTRDVDEVECGPTDSGLIWGDRGGPQEGEDGEYAADRGVGAPRGPDTRGDMESPPRWTIESTRQLSAGLTEQGHRSPSGWYVGCCTRPP